MKERVSIGFEKFGSFKKMFFIHNRSVFTQNTIKFLYRFTVKMTSFDHERKDSTSELCHQRPPCSVMFIFTYM